MRVAIIGELTVRVILLNIELNKRRKSNNDQDAQRIIIS